MVDVERTFVVRPEPGAVIDYLKDFARAELWDPGTVSCHRNGTGPVEVGATWRNVSKLLGRETELTYELTVLEPGHLVFVGTNKTATSTDDITATADGTGSQVTYHANIEFHGIAKLADPVMKIVFERLGDKTVEAMTSTLDQL